MLFVVLFCFEIVLPTKSRVANLKILYSTARSREWGGGSREREERAGRGRRKDERKGKAQ